MRFVLSFALLWMGVLTYAQILEPVKWKTSSKKISEGVYDLVITASIDPGWHLYSQTVPEGGPIPTTFLFEEEKGYTLIGKTSEEKGHEIDDPVFNMRIKYFDGSARFTQRVKAAVGTKISTEVEFMVCNDTRCLPPTYNDLEFDLKH